MEDGDAAARSSDLLNAQSCILNPLRGAVYHNGPPRTRGDYEIGTDFCLTRDSPAPP
jgi:hypothetical protein